MVLQNFVEAMLPKDESFFGDAASADAYRSMMADQLATQLAKTGKLGIAKAIEGAEAHRTSAGHLQSAQPASLPSVGSS